MKTTYIYAVLVVLIIAGLILVRNASDSSTNPDRMSKYDSFAQCLADAGVKFYGAYWCPNCQDQKRMFENSAKLPYIECSTPNGQAQLPVCIDAGIKAYPTWEFSDGTRLEGVRQLSELAEKGACQLPS